MIISCGQCSTRYRIDASALQKDVSRARCGRCGHVFAIPHPRAQGEAVSALAVQDSLPAAYRAPAPEDIHIPGIEQGDTRSGTRVIAICNQKGGVAKTTTCLNLATSLVLMKKRVLVIDFDIQANLSLLLGVNDAPSFYEASDDAARPLSEYVRETGLKFWLLPSNSKMTLLSKKHLGREDFQYMLRDRLAAIKPYFDYVIIDTPPSGDFFTLNALLAADMATIPSQAEFLSMNGINHIQNMIKVIREQADHNIDYQILVTMFDRQNTAAKVVFTKMNREFTGNLFRTIIEKDENVPQSQIVLSPTMYYNRGSRAGLQYFSLAKEIVGM